jgi:DNA-directed RNA polymerase specialized sigma24 family protein
MNGEAIIRAHLAAMLSMGESFAPLTHAQAVRVAFGAIYLEAVRCAGVLPRDDNHLVICGVRAVHEAQAGLLDRDLLISRIEALTKDEQTAYSLRYEHGMSDAEIAAAIGIDEDAVVSLMLRALLKITGVAE